MDWLGQSQYADQTVYWSSISSAVAEVGSFLATVAALVCTCKSKSSDKSQYDVHLESFQSCIYPIPFSFMEMDCDLHEYSKIEPTKHLLAPQILKFDGCHWLLVLELSCVLGTEKWQCFQLVVSSSIFLLSSPYTTFVLKWIRKMCKAFAVMNCSLTKWVNHSGYFWFIFIGQLYFLPYAVTGNMFSEVTIIFRLSFLSMPKWRYW